MLYLSFVPHLETKYIGFWEASMLILPDNDLHRFQIKKLTKEIETQLAKWRDEEVLRARFHIAERAWADTWDKTGFDDDVLWNLKFELERMVFLYS